METWNTSTVFSSSESYTIIGQANVDEQITCSIGSSSWIYIYMDIIYIYMDIIYYIYGYNIISSRNAFFAADETACWATVRLYKSTKFYEHIQDQVHGS